MGQYIKYIELRCRSAFTFLDGVSLPEDLIAAAQDLGYPALALADRDGVYGAPRFYKAAQNTSVRPIVGSDVTIATREQLLLLVENRTGYKNLCKLITRGQLAHPKGEGFVSLADLEEYSTGLFAIFPRAIATAHAALLDRLVATFGHERLAVEIQRHFEEDDDTANAAALALARQHRLRIVATNDVRYARERNARLYDVVSCIRDGMTLNGAGIKLLKNRERHLKPPAVMAALFRDMPQALENTLFVANRCAFTLADLGYRFPDYPVPPGETTQSLLETLTWEQARARFHPRTDAVRRQLERELALIGQLELAGYFLIVWDIVRFCREQGILVQGRGSAANSAVCYALGITAVDPIKMDLLFERFLSEERDEWPDIDLDLPSGAKRERVIQYVYGRYGKLSAAMTANVITFRGRSAVREVGKVLGMSPEPLDRLARLVGRHGFVEMDAASFSILSREAGIIPTDPRASLLGELCAEIQNLPRHLGQHSGGMVVAAGRLDEIVPLESAAMPGRVVVQWDKDDCADLKIIKVDLLGLGMMALLEEAVALIQKHEGVAIDLARLPHDDRAVYDLCCRADTIGVFQIESRAQMATLPRMQPRCFYDLVVEVGLIRPGPIVGKMVHPYLRRRAGREAVQYPHPALRPILERTFGVPLFQEQLMRVAMVAAGFSGGKAEELRRAMGFKRSVERMHAIEADLRAGMAKNGIAGHAAEEIVRGITSFAQYGFPESHAASFALIAYASAYLKVHHAAAFYTALLNCYPMGFYHPSTIVKDAERHGIQVVPIDVNRSEWKCTIESRAVRLGLRYVAGLRQASAHAIASAAPFASLDDMVTRVRLRRDSGDATARHRRDATCEPSEPAMSCPAGHSSSDERPDLTMITTANEHSLRRDELATLASIGAFSGLGKTRRSALWQLDALAQRGTGLFSRIPPAEDPLPLAEMSDVEKTGADYAGMGLTTGPHPVAHLRASLAVRGIVRASDLAHLPNGRSVRVAGIVICRQRPGTAKGFLFVSLEDETGIANIIVTPQLFEAHRALLVTASSLIVEGTLQKAEGVIHVRGRRFLAVESAATAATPLTSVPPAPLGDRDSASLFCAELATASHDFH